MQGIQAISDFTTYRLRRPKQQKNMNYTSEYDRLIGELSQMTIALGMRAQIERRKRDIKAAYQGSHHTNTILLP